MKGQNPIFAALNADTSITIRDYIAIQAMVGVLANTHIVPSVPPKGIAEDCYKIADAMIKQSEVQHE